MPGSRTHDKADDSATDVLVAILADIAAGAAPLVAGQTRASLGAALTAGGGVPHLWTRRVDVDFEAAPWPPNRPFTSAFVRMPKSKEELDFLLDAVASVLLPGAPIVLFGANDEGIRSAGARLEPFVDDVATLATKRHCRVLVGPRRRTIDGLRGSLAHWRQTISIDLADGTRPWITYPGLFARGRLDEGTRMLIERLPPLAPAARVLDYASGTGIIAAAVTQRLPEAGVDLVDNDTLAIEAARENVPSARAIAGERLRSVGGSKYAAILSNPPIHDGIAENLTVLSRLLQEAPSHLEPGGVLQIVILRRIKVRPLLEAVFSTVESIADDGRFTVWRCRGRSPQRKLKPPSRPSRP